MLHLLTLRAAGICEVVVAGRSAERLELARRFGADWTIDVRDHGAEEAVAQINGGFGPDLVIECTGQVAGWTDAFARVRRGGRVVFFGGCPSNTTLMVDTRRMHYDNLTLLAPFHFRPRDVNRAFDLLRERKLEAGRVINASRPLNELGEVFASLEGSSVLKCAVIP
jgi:L-iditol 2-dehydrogenase